MNVTQLKDFVASKPAGTKLDIATSQYADNTTPAGYHFDAYSNAAAIRSLVKQELIEAVYMWRYYEVTVLPLDEKDPAPKVYFVKNRMHDPSKDSIDGSDQFIAIKHGATTYSPTTVYDQGHADTLNDRQGITKAMAKAAHTCSMFNGWDKFDGMVKTFEKAVPGNTGD